MAVAVHIENLTQQFGTLRAVDDISISIEAGELFFLLGPSGCGKTTLLRCIAGFYRCEQGSIRMGERDISSLPPHRRDTGMVFQSYALWPHMSVRENVAFGLQMRKVRKREVAQQVDQALAMVQMTDRADHKPNQLSGGQQQRVALARALVIHPQCLLLDEPLSNLDAKLRLDMRTEIRRICKEAGLTAIYVTHDQKEALSIADRLAVMRDGRIEQVGTPLDVYRHPANRFVASFIGETNFLEGTVTGGGTALELDTPVGTISASLPPGRPPLSQGQRVTLSLRPEALRVAPAPTDAPNRFGGRIHHTVYQGEVAQHQVTLPGRNGGDGATLKVFELNPSIVARDVAEPATVWIRPEHVVVLTA